MSQYNYIENSRQTRIGAFEHYGNKDYILNERMTRLGYYDSHDNKTYDIGGKLIGYGDVRTVLLNNNMMQRGIKW